MSDHSLHTIPPTVLATFSRLPLDQPVVLLMRHSVRLVFAPGDDGAGMPITPEGWGLARQLGAAMGENLRSIHVSPLLRCEQTAQALNEGAGTLCQVRADRMLGEPSVYIFSEVLATQTWARLGNEGVMAHQVGTSDPLPGMMPAEPAAHQLLRHMLIAGGKIPGFHVFVTHDSILAPTVAHLMGYSFVGADWPVFLEAAFFWREGRQIIGAYREKQCRINKFRGYSTAMKHQK